MVLRLQNVGWLERMGHSKRVFRDADGDVLWLWLRPGPPDAGVRYGMWPAFGDLHPYAMDLAGLELVEVAP